MIMCVSLVTTPSTTSPTLQVWAACQLSHSSPEGCSRRASSQYYVSETVSYGSTTTVTRLSLTCAAVTSDRQENMGEHQGSPGTETKYCRGKSSSTHDTLRRHPPNETLHGFLILPVSASLSFHVILSFDDTKSRPRFHLYSWSAVFPLPPSVPTLPQLPLISLFPQLHCRSLTPPSHFFFFFLSCEFSAAWIRTSQSCQSHRSIQPSFHPLFQLLSLSFQRSSQSSFPTSNLARLLLFQHPIPSLPRHSSMPLSSLTIITTLHSAHAIIPSFQNPLFQQTTLNIIHYSLFSTYSTGNINSAQNSIIYHAFALNNGYRCGFIVGCAVNVTI